MVFLWSYKCIGNKVKGQRGRRFLADQRSVGMEIEILEDRNLIEIASCVVDETIALKSDDKGPIFLPAYLNGPSETQAN